MDEARRTVTLTLPKLRDFEPTRAGGTRESATAVMAQLFHGAETTQERGARILEVLCTVNASATGHLYLCTDQGPSLIASQGAEEAQGLFDYVCDSLTRELQASDDETAILSMDDTRLSDDLTEFTDEAGNSYRLIFLTTVTGDAPRHVGVAVLVDGGGERRAADLVLTSALASHMIEAGDTPGIATHHGTGPASS
jgi:hypothetical protein